MSLGDLIRRYRLAAGLSQEDLAERAGLSVRGISDLERGRRLAPHMETLRLLSDGLGLDDVDRAALIAAARPELQERQQPAETPSSTAPQRSHRPMPLPAPPTVLIGRDDLVDRIASHLRDDGIRLVTLTGPGGVGKTRVGLASGRAIAPQFPDGVLFLDLGDLSSSQQLGPALLDELDFTGNQGADPVGQLIDVLRDSSMLLILDSFEHLLDAATSISRVLAFCPGVSIIVTSRIRLRLRGELVLSVPPLVLNGHGPTNETPSPAVQLFLDRAREAVPDFELTSQNAATIEQICGQLDGLPLAIELAATWLRVLPPADLLHRIDDQLPSLGGAARDAPERHQTLHSTLTWSLRMLSEDEQRLFRRLAVFSGGATLDALQQVGIDQPLSDVELLGLLSNLVDNSLVRQVTDDFGTTRYTMLDTIRAFGRDNSAERGDAAALRNAHLAWLVGLAEEAETELVGPNEPAWRNRLISEQANIRTGLDWAIEQENAESGLRLAGALWRFWSKRGALIEGREWLAKVLALPGEPEPALLAKSSQALANMSFDLGDYEEAQRRFETSLAIRRTLPDKALIANALNGLGLVSFALGDLERAQSLHRESLQLSREAGSLLGIGNSLSNWADVEMALGNTAESRRLQEEGLAIRRQLGDENSVAYSLYNLGILARQEDRFEDALGYLAEATAHFRASGDLFGQAYGLCDLGVIRAQLGDIAAGALDQLESLRLRIEISDQRGMIDCLEGAARILVLSGDTENALRLIGAASSRRSLVHSPRTPAEVREVARWTDPVPAADHRSGSELEDEGGALSLPQAIDLVRESLLPVTAKSRV